MSPCALSFPVELLIELGDGENKACVCARMWMAVVSDAGVDRLG